MRSKCPFASHAQVAYLTSRRLIGGHEFVGTVVEMGSTFGPDAQGRPELYRTLRLGDKVVSPFTVSCGECQ